MANNPRRPNNQPQQPQQQQPQEGAPFALLQIQDIDDWLRFNGLRSADDDPFVEPAFGSFLSELNRNAATAQQQAEERYQQHVHALIFKEALAAEEQQHAVVQKLLQVWHESDERMEIVTADTVLKGIPLSRLAAECDFVFTLASSRRYMHNLTTHTTTASTQSDPQQTQQDDDEDDKPVGHHHVTLVHLNRNNNSNNANSSTVDTMVSLSLEDYSSAAVQEFLQVAFCQKPVTEIHDDFVVDCCHIGHYLQCQRILEGTSNILLHHVDSDNCLALCQMADQLELPDLFERALFHMLKSLEDLESQDAYECFSPELKDRIADIRAVFTNHHRQKNSPTTTTATGDQPQQSAFNPLNNNNNNNKKLYFTSLEEYIAIFAENVQYHRERLEEAKEQNVGRQFSPYAHSKIQKQELRVLTLEAMLQEQKRLFGRANNINNKGNQSQNQNQYQNKRPRV